MPSARGTLTWTPASEQLDLLAAPVAAAIGTAPGAQVSPIDADLADTAAFCDAYDVALEASANCVVVAGRRDGVGTMLVEDGVVTRLYLVRNPDKLGSLASEVDLRRAL